MISLFAKSFARFGPIVAAVLAVAVPQSRGVTIDFEDAALPAGGVLVPALPYLEDGFRIRNGTSGSQNGIRTDASDPYPNSGSVFFDWVFGTSVVLEEASGALFSLHSFDAGQTREFSGPANSHELDMNLIGHLDGGGTVLTTIKYGDPWANFVLGAEWTNLLSVEFVATNDGDGAFDNIVVNVVSKPVPDTSAMLILLSLGAFALAVAKSTQVRGVLKSRAPEDKLA